MVCLRLRSFIVLFLPSFLLSASPLRGPSAYCVHQLSRGWPPLRPQLGAEQEEEEEEEEREERAIKEPHNSCCHAPPLHTAGRKVQSQHLLVSTPESE